MPEDAETEYSTPIPLRDNDFRPGTPERPNPWTRLEAVSAVRERLGWLSEYFVETVSAVESARVGLVLDQLALELHTALWADLAACEAVHKRVGRGQLAATWDRQLFDLE